MEQTTSQLPTSDATTMPTLRETRRLRLPPAPTRPDVSTIEKPTFRSLLDQTAKTDLSRLRRLLESDERRACGLDATWFGREPDLDALVRDRQARREMVWSLAGLTAGTVVGLTLGLLLIVATW